MSNREERLDDLLKALGKRIGLTTPLALGPNGAIALQHTEVGDVGIERAGSGAAVRLYATAGALPDSAREAFLIRLLRANLFNADLEPATLAIAPDDERVLVCYTLPLDDVDEVTLENVLGNFIAIAARWRTELRHQTAGSPESNPLPLSGPGFPFGIRV